MRNSVLLSFLVIAAFAGCVSPEGSSSEPVSPEADVGDLRTEVAPIEVGASYVVGAGAPLNDRGSYFVGVGPYWAFPVIEVPGEYEWEVTWKTAVPAASWKVHFQSPNDGATTYTSPVGATSMKGTMTFGETGEWPTALLSNGVSGDVSWTMTLRYVGP